MPLREYWMEQGRRSAELPYRIWEHCFKEWLGSLGELGERISAKVDKCGDADQIRLLADFCDFPVHNPDYLKNGASNAVCGPSGDLPDDSQELCGSV